MNGEDKDYSEIISQITETLPEDKRGDAQKLIENLIQTKTSGLLKKRDELLEKLKKKEEGAKRLDMIKKSEYNELIAAQKQLDELLEQKAKDEGDYNALVERMNKKHASELSQAQQRLKELEDTLQVKDSALSKHLIENQLVSALSASGVKADYIPAVKALLQQKAKLTQTDDGEYTPVIGEKPLQDYIKEWSATEGKAFIQLQSGGGGLRAGGGGAGKMTIEEIAAIPDQKLRFAAYKENGYTK